MALLPAALILATYVRLRVVERLGAAGSVYTMCILLLAGWSLICLTPLSPLFLYAGVIVSAPYLMTFPAMLALFALRFDRSELAQVQSLSSTAVSVGFIVGMPSFAYAFDASARGVAMWTPFAASWALVVTGTLIKMAALCPDGSVRRALLARLRGETSGEMCTQRDAKLDPATVLPAISRGELV